MLTSIDRAKAAHNFMPAMQRPACRNRQQVQEMHQASMREGARLQCRSGKFMVTAMAVCERHVFYKSGATT